MGPSMSPKVFFENQIRLAEELYKRGNVEGAIQIVNALTFGYANTSENHRKISQFLVAYQIQWTLLQNHSTHYNILKISNPFCSHQTIQRNYLDLVVKLCPETNKSIAAKSAFETVDTAWRVLSDPESRIHYNSAKGFDKWDIYSEEEPYQSVKKGKRQCIEVIDDSDSYSDSDSDSDFDYN